VLRRRCLPPELAEAHRAFLVVLSFVEAAKDAIVSTIPSARAPGRSLPVGLVEFEASLRRAEAHMSGWRHEEVRDAWAPSASGLQEALNAGERLRLEAPDLGFEELLARVEDLIAPLEVFEHAVERFRALRR
jgi:hypothetical protein